MQKIPENNGVIILNIQNIEPMTGRLLKEDSSTINLADILATKVPQNVTFQNGVTATGDGSIITVGGNKTLKVSIYGTATARTVNFYAINANSEKIALLGNNISTGNVASNTTGTSSETWKFDVTALNQIYVNISAISGGNLTITGTLVG